MNKHGDHDASCLCCKYLELDPGFVGSEVTAPGEDCYRCLVKHFDYAWTDSPESLHKEFRRAETCPDFEGRP